MLHVQAPTDVLHLLVGAINNIADIMKDELSQDTLLRGAVPFLSAVHSSGAENAQVRSSSSLVLVVSLDVLLCSHACLS